MTRWNWLRYAAAGTALALITTGCSLGGSKEIDPPPVGYEMNVNPESVAVNAGAQQQLRTTAFFLDAEGFVAPLNIQVASTDAIAKETLKYMVEDGPVQSQLPKGFRALLPKGTQVNGIDIRQDEKLAIVDFSKEFTNYNIQDERKILEAITWSLTSFPSVEKVQLWVDGKQLKEMPMDGTPLDAPLSRQTLGINIEAAEGVNFSKASAVTLYFMNQTEDSKGYYVPVTRLIAQTDDLAKATVSELIKGPSKASLASVVMPTAELLNAAVTDELATVDFSDKLLGPDQKAPSEALQAVVLSLTETTGADKVQIKVNGNAKVTSTANDANYSVPVSRPVHINDIKL
ncbi:GerMN domain-containing protein [Paenibacillus turpanensis]|uniref:GerMN domain-containing protein n=1 Tax=Paenibacillus turpanensis TaxID=2689078 RepID=UPI00140B03C4|nr:GerMN domain-containing protein [Paenibacillus turpanensis]